MADYWIKWFHDILDDPKMATLPDRLWRRFSELCLLTGRLHPDRSGQLPDTRQVAWALRLQTDDLQIDMDQLASIDLIQPIPGGWVVTNFSKRQRAATATERVQQFRKRSQLNYGTGMERNGNEKLHRSDIDIDIDIDKESAARLPRAVPHQEEKTKKPKREKVPPDERLSHPALVAYRDEAHLHIPVSWRDEVIRTVQDAGRWSQIIHQWIGNGWNKQNIAGLLDAYRTGGIKQKSPAAGTVVTAVDLSPAEYAAQRAAEIATARARREAVRQESQARKGAHDANA